MWDVRYSSGRAAHGVSGGMVIDPRRVGCEPVNFRINTSLPPHPKKSASSRLVLLPFPIYSKTLRGICREFCQEAGIA